MNSLSRTHDGPNWKNRLHHNFGVSLVRFPVHFPRSPMTSLYLKRIYPCLISYNAQLQSRKYWLKFNELTLERVLVKKDYNVQLAGIKATGSFKPSSICKLDQKTTSLFVSQNHIFWWSTSWNWWIC